MKERLTYLEVSNDEICFNLNVMEEIQNEYGSMQKWGAVVENKEGGEPQIKDLKYGLASMINEGIDIENEKNGTDRKPLTQKQIGRLIGQVGFQKVISAIKELTITSTKTDDEPKNE